jgi:hypothetical protein
MTTVTICEQEKTETGFKAILSFDRHTSFDVEVRDPFAIAQEQNLEWYFERWLVFPGLDTVRAEAAQASVREYGEALFEMVFGDRDAYHYYRQCPKPLRIEIEGDSPEFQALHWEALWEPDAPRPLAVDGVMVRHSTRPPREEVRAASAEVIRLLVVTARPGEEQDINHRTISRPLMTLIQKSRLRVQVDLLRPATFEALSNHLEEKGAGYYHIVHLDLHGSVIAYDQLASLSHDRYSFRFGASNSKFGMYQEILTNLQ